MADNLRDRIAQLARDHWTESPEDVAAAIVEELGLRQEWLTEESSRLGIVALTRPERPTATRVSSPWVDQTPPPRRLWDVFAAADKTRE